MYQAIDGKLECVREVKDVYTISDLQADMKRLEDAIAYENTRHEQQLASYQVELDKVSELFEEAKKLGLI